MDAMKEFFASELKQLQAQDFFFNEPGGLGGRGIPISERTAIENVQPIDLSSIKLPDISTQIGNINVEIKKIFKSEDTANEIVNALIEAIRNNSLVQDAINEKIDNF